MQKPKKETIWELLIPSDLAESLMKRAEILSVESKFLGSIRAFKKAAKLFDETERFLDVKDWEVEDPEEMELVNNMKETVRLKRRYCLARINQEKKNTAFHG